MNKEFWDEKINKTMLYDIGIGIGIGIITGIMLADIYHYLVYGI